MKYSALSQHLAGIDASSVELDFEQVEEIIGAPLPLSAKRHQAWWANEKSGTHTWAHLWRAAGWLRDKVDLQRHIVSFRRSDEQIEAVLKELRPRTQETIFDLLQLAGISTDEWLSKADGQPVTRIKANPSFCYNGAFGSLREGYALCIWHDTMEVREGAIVFEENLRDLAERLQADGHNPANGETRKRRSLTQATRARAFDEALNISYARGKAVSVILTEGDRRNREKLGEGSSHVQFRSLDPTKWYVHKYNDETGEALLVRGIKPAGVVGDATELRDDEEAGPQDVVQQRAIKIRRGQEQFREKLLAAYSRTCAITGCKIVDLLEAAHIRLHAEEANYRVTNGLLLRADVHTLFDLGLLAVDTRMQVRLAPELLRSEYKLYDGKGLRQPEYPSEMPNADALERRYHDFKTKHGL